MKSRKNRPAGSHLQHRCVCSTRNARQHPVCLACEVKKLCKDTAAGETLWAFTPHFARTQITKDMKSLESDVGATKGSQQWSWKSFRAGKATAMAQAGMSLGTILLAGEWRSAAFLRYLDEEAVQRIPFNEQQLWEQGANSDSEGE